MSRTSRRLPGAALASILVILLGLLAGCGGSDSGGGDATSPADRLATAEKTLATTKGVTLSLKTDKLPQGTNGILSAKGLGTDAPAFKGTISAVLNGLSGELPVVAVDNKVYVQLFGAPFKAVDPADFGAPDPATFFGPEGSLPGLLSNVTSVKAGDDVRDGSQVLSTITGKIPGSAVKKLFSSAGDSEFDAVFTLDDSDHLVGARVSGPFYGGSGDLTYTIDFSKYGASEPISAP